MKDLEAENYLVFTHAANPKYSMEFKLYVSQDGCNITLQSNEDGILFCPMGRFMGTFLQGQPAKSHMEGSSQWIDFKVDNLETKVMACKKESSMAGADVLPAYAQEPDTIKKFLQHLDKIGKTQYDMVSHKFTRDEIGQVTGIVADDITCLPLPTATPSKKKVLIGEHRRLRRH